MKSISIIILAVLFFNMCAYSQELQISGYYENQFFPQKVKDETLLQDYNKLRIDLQADINENITFNGDFIYQTYHGTTSYNILSFLPKKKSGLIQSPPEEFEMKLKNRQFLDNAYITYYSNDFVLRIGKQQLPVGSGYSWNPTDIYNNKNLLDPTYEKEGVNAFKLEYSFSNEGIITGIISLDEDWKRSTKAISIKEHLAGFDVTLSAAEKGQQFNSMFLIPSYETRRVFGLDFSGEAFGLGVWFEGAYNNMDNSDNYEQILGGLNYTFESGLFFQLEYYFNGLGNSNGEYSLFEWGRLMSDKAVNLGTQYIAASQKYTFFEFLDWSNFMITNLSDNSFIYNPFFDYTLNDNTVITAIGYFPFGKDDSEFGEFGVGGIFRLRVYF